MDFELKPLPEASIEPALQKADHYRLLNDPAEAESICLDVLEVDPDNQHATRTLLLALTDQFRSRGRPRIFRDAQDVVAKLDDPYERAYYAGIVFERQAKAALDRGTPGCEYDAFEWFEDAMEAYEDAESLRPDDVDDPVLRWNSCARWILRHKLEQRPPEDHQPYLE